MQQWNQAIDFLMEEGGPTLRYLTANQLLMDGKRARQLRKAWRDDVVGRWIEALRTDLPIHGAQDETFETVTGKLFELGARRQSSPLSRPMSAYLQRLNEEPRSMLDNLCQIIIGSAAARLGFDVNRYAARRLRVVHDATRHFDFDIYRTRDSYRLPPRYKDYPVIRQTFAPDGVFRLPYVHDLYLMNAADFNRTQRRRYLDVLRYVLSPGYQSLSSGFGYVEERLRGKSRWLVVGWKAGFDDSLIRMELQASLPRPLHRTPDLTAWKSEPGWSFPQRYLLDQSPGYWVSGRRMGLMQRPRRAKQRRLESTFRALRLLAGAQARHGRN